MKIAIFDSNQGKFMQMVQESWGGEHESRRVYSYDPELVEWADVIWIDGCDNNARVATTIWDENPSWYFGAHDMANKKVIIRCIDIECWYGHHRNVDWKYVDDVIFMAPHIKSIVEKDIDFSAYKTRVHIIPCGVDINRFSFVDKPIGRKIAWVCEKWPAKGIDYALQIMANLNSTIGFELHTIGGWNDRYPWEEAYQKDFIRRNDIKWIDYGVVSDQAEWLKDKDFLLSCSKKEAFGYNIAEGMSMGLVPVIHRFFGCENIWDEYVWDTTDFAVDMIERAYYNQPDRQQYRDYIINKGYDLDTMVNKFNGVIYG